MLDNINKKMTLDVKLSQGQERTNIIRLNQLLKDIEELMERVKETQNNIGEQEKAHDDKRAIKNGLEDKLQELKLRESK